MKKLFLFFTLLFCLSTRAQVQLTPVSYNGYNADGTPQTNMVLFQPYPYNTPFFTVGTNVVGGVKQFGITPNSSGYFSNNILPITYAITISNSTSVGFFFTCPYTTAYTPIVPVGTPVVNIGGSYFQLLTNWLGYYPATNTLVGIISALGYTPPTNNYAGISNALGFGPATNTQTGLIDTIGYTPAGSNYLSLVGALGFNPATNSNAGIQFALGYNPTNIAGVDTATNGFVSYATNQVKALTATSWQNTNGVSGFVFITGTNIVRFNSQSVELPGTNTMTNSELYMGAGWTLTNYSATYNFYAQ